MEYAPELEWRLAAKEFGYTWEQFCRLPGARQSDVVAAFRAERQIDAVISHESNKKHTRRPNARK